MTMPYPRAVATPVSGPSAPVGDRTLTLAEPFAVILRDALAETARHAQAAQTADDPVAIRRAIAAMWSAGHVAYQATLDAEDATRKAALAKLENAA